MKKFVARYPFLLLIIILALTVRLYRIDYPLLDWHSFRQADTASVTREYVKNGVDLLRPAYHDHSNIQSGFENPEGYRMVEFPFINAGTAALLQAFPSLPLVPTSRMISVLFSLGTLISLFLFVRSRSGLRVAYMSALTFAILPYSIYYSRVILPEPAMLFFSTFAIYAFDRWIKRKHFGWYLASLLSLALGFLLKPFVLFLAPVFAVLVGQKWGIKAFKNIWLYIYGAAVIAPTLLWRDWITQFPEGIPASYWLYNGNGIRLRPAWFRWLGYERLTKIILGYAGLIFLPFGLFDKNKDTWLYLAWWLGIGAYLITFATGNVQHDYYQVIAIPIISITVGKGAVMLYKFLENQWRLRLKNLAIYSHIFGLIVTAGLYMLMLALGWQQVRGNFNVNHWEYVRAGEVVDNKTPPDAKVIAPAMGDTAFLFQTNRTGWPIGYNIENKIRMGATHYITTTDDDEARELSEKYFIIEKTETYLLIDLTKTKEDAQ